MKTCTIDGCSKPHKARGLCGTHYNQTLPNRHAKITVECDACREPCRKEQRTRRYKGTYCSELCRDYAQWGGLTCKLPANHPALASRKQPTPRPFPSIGGVLISGICHDCGLVFTAISRNGEAKYCSSQCQQRSSRRRRRAREFNAPGEFRYSQIMRQYSNQGRVCAYCLTKCDGLPEPEHVLALSRGGRNDMTNLVAACRACNSDKGDLTLTEWMEDRARRRLPLLNVMGTMFKHIVWYQPTVPAHRSLSLPRVA